MHPLVSFLRQAGVMAPAGGRSELTAAEWLVGEYRGWLVGERVPPCVVRAISVIDADPPGSLTPATSPLHTRAEATVSRSRSRSREAFMPQRCADASAAPTSAAEAGAAGWVLYWASFVTA